MYIDKICLWKSVCIYHYLAVTTISPLISEMFTPSRFRVMQLKYWYNPPNEFYFDCRGPVTIADLQSRLVQLTAQPSEMSLGGTPPSHPPTPHFQSSYESYMVTLQQKLASISMPTQMVRFLF